MDSQQAQPPAAYPVVAAVRPRTDGMAVASMVLGIVWVFWIGSVLAVIFGHISLRRINRDQVLYGKGMAIAGLILGYIGVATLVLNIMLLIFGVASQPSGHQG